MIRGEGISFRAGGEVLLDRVSLDLRGGEVTAILGPNGAGKSTLLKCLSGSHVPSAGRVTMDGQPLAGFRLMELARRRAVLAQSVPVSFPFSVLEVVAMGRAPYKGSEGMRRDDEIIQAALRLVDAWHLKDRVFPSMSGGEQQRVHLARVLAQLWGQPGAHLFLDEPTSALDLKHQHQILGLARDLASEQGFAVCFVIHDLALAGAYADRAALLNGGRMAAAGPIGDVLTTANVEQVFQVSADLVFPGAVAPPVRGAPARSGLRP